MTSAIVIVERILGYMPVFGEVIKHERVRALMQAFRSHTVLGTFKEDSAEWELLPFIVKSVHRNRFRGGFLDVKYTPSYISWEEAAFWFRNRYDASNVVVQTPGMVIVYWHRDTIPISHFAALANFGEEFYESEEENEALDPTYSPPNGLIIPPPRVWSPAPRVENEVFMCEE